MGPGVRILCPSNGELRTPDGKSLKIGPPWPDYIKSKSGELPEYVVNESGKWVPAQSERHDHLEDSTIERELI